MHLDLEDQHRSVKKKAALRTYALLTILSAITLTSFFYLHSKGWGVTVDMKKLADAFAMNGAPIEGTDIPPLPTIAQQQTVTHRSESHSQLSGMRPLNWSVHIKKFNEIFIRHPACDPDRMKWTQMECSNFRARAMKRFGEEWSKNSYWNGSQIVNNKLADARVNAELSL